MAIPNTRATLKDYCLRALGKPVIDINVDADQIEDRIDEAVQYFAQYHTDGVERMYLKYLSRNICFLTQFKERNGEAVTSPVICLDDILLISFLNPGTKGIFLLNSSITY